MGTSGKFNILIALIDSKVGNDIIYRVSLSFFHDVPLHGRHTQTTTQLQHVWVSLL
jgi:hypothetical protein